MRRADVFVNAMPAGVLEEHEVGNRYVFRYHADYSGHPVSLTMPVADKVFEFHTFPPFFDGLLPEGVQLEALLRLKKIDRHDCFSQLIAVGRDLVGAVTVEGVD